MIPDEERQETPGLVDRARAGDRQAFSELMKEHMKPIVALTFRMTGDKEAAFDLAQETFLSAWQSLSGYRGDAKFASWLYRIATNKTLNYLKAHKPFVGFEVDEQVASPQIGPERELHQKELRRDVLQFMQALPTQQRLVFNLRFYRQQPFAEIAEALGSAVGTVKTHYREALKKLKEFAVEKGWE